MVDIAIFGQPVSSLKVTVLQKERARERKQSILLLAMCAFLCTCTHGIRHKRMECKTGIGVRIHNWVHTPVAVCLCQKPLESGMF